MTVPFYWTVGPFDLNEGRCCEASLRCLQLLSNESDKKEGIEVEEGKEGRRG